MSKISKAARKWTDSWTCLNEFDIEDLRVAFEEGANYKWNHLDEPALLDVIRKWTYHWMTKEPGYETRARLCDANMAHHLAKMLKEKIDE